MISITMSDSASVKAFRAHNCRILHSEPNKLIQKHGQQNQSCDRIRRKGQHSPMRQLFVLLSSEDGQDIAEYAVMVAVI